MVYILIDFDRPGDIFGVACGSPERRVREPGVWDLVYGILAGDSIAFSRAVEFDSTDEEGRSSKERNTFNRFRCYL